MATGETLFVFTPPDGAGLVASNNARAGTIAAADGLRAVLLFIGSGGSADESAIFEHAWPANYAGGGVDVVVHYSTDGTSVGAVQWEVSMEVTTDGADLNAGGADFGTATDITDTPAAATADQLDVTAVGAISHANCGSPSGGDMMRFKIARDHDHATNTDDAQLHRIVITET